jgi:signal transduction histidine kinase
VALGLATLAELQLRAYADCCANGRLTTAGIVLTLAETLPLLWRRRFPVAVLVITGAGAVAQRVLCSPITDFGTFGVLVAFATVSACSPRRLAVPLAVATPFGILAAQLLDSALQLHYLMVVYVEFAAAWVVGENIRYRRRHVADLEDRAARVERERIARELHDVVAQGLSVISLQAGAARSVMDAAPERARECLSSIETLSREAWTEMRRFLDASAPGPGLDQVAELIQRFEAAGLAVELVVSGAATRLPPDADLCAYRLVQESLTNALRHADPRRARVSIGYDPRSVELEIANERTAAAGPPAGGDGRHGLAGMRRRVGLAGGELSVEQGSGRFTVRARLPAIAPVP